MQTQFDTQTITASRAQQQASTVFLAKVFNWMAIGLGLTGGIAYLTDATGLNELIPRALIFMMIIAEFGLVVFLAARIDKMSPATATGSFVGYSVLNGITMSLIFLAYAKASIAGTFLITAGMFGAMSVYGLVTKRDLTGMGSFMFMGLIGMLIAVVVNFFLQSSALSYAISGIGVIVFTGLTAYDVQKLKHMGEQGIMEQGEGAIQKGAIAGALTLYLDFILLFQMLLHFFGGEE